MKSKMELMVSCALPRSEPDKSRNAMLPGKASLRNKELQPMRRVLGSKANKHEHYPCSWL